MARKRKKRKTTKSIQTVSDKPNPLDVKFDSSMVSGSFEAINVPDSTIGEDDSTGLSGSIIGITSGEICIDPGTALQINFESKSKSIEVDGDIAVVENNSKGVKQSTVGSEDATPVPGAVSVDSVPSSVMEDEDFTNETQESQTEQTLSLPVAEPENEPVDSKKSKPRTFEYGQVPMDYKPTTLEYGQVSDEPVKGIPEAPPPEPETSRKKRKRSRKNKTDSSVVENTKSSHTKKDPGTENIADEKNLKKEPVETHLTSVSEPEKAVISETEVIKSGKKTKVIENNVVSGELSIKSDNDASPEKPKVVNTVPISTEKSVHGKNPDIEKIVALDQEKRKHLRESLKQIIMNHPSPFKLDTKSLPEKSPDVDKNWSEPPVTEKAPVESPVKNRIEHKVITATEKTQGKTPEKTATPLENRLISSNFHTQQKDSADDAIQEKDIPSKGFSQFEEDFFEAELEDENDYSGLEDIINQIESDSPKRSGILDSIKKLFISGQPKNEPVKRTSGPRKTTRNNRRKPNRKK
ncbi:MAG: hypothetical protein JXR95_09240 [Deltaproteobacteria bacterium]|nr:hypothetical protein [Deltaproteobacteria bacterium]